MSSYVSFWAKNRDGAVTPLCSFCRSSEFYQAAQEAGIEGIWEDNKEKEMWQRDKWAEPYTQEKASKFETIIKDKISQTKERINELEKKINFIKDMANTTIDERLQVIAEYDEYLAEYKEDLEALQAAAAYINFLEDIRDSVAPSYRSTKEERDSCLWAGRECGMPGVKNEEE